MNNIIYKIEYSCAGDIGLVRHTNQDNFVCDETYLKNDSDMNHFSFAGCTGSDSFHLFGVFDGLGGEECGEVAAFIAAKEAAAFKPSGLIGNELKNYCLNTNRKICSYADDNGIYSMGTTAAMLGFSEKGICLCNIGDSRIFKYDGIRLKQVSVDHLAPAPFGRKQPLSQNLGIPEDFMIIDPYIKPLPLNKDDIFIICSDGLTDMVSFDEIWRIVSENPVHDCAQKLVDKAIKNGGHDNTTVIVIGIE